MKINSSITEQDYAEYLEFIGQGLSQRSACNILSLSRSSVQRYIKKLNEIDGGVCDSSNDDTSTTKFGAVGLTTDLGNKPKVLYYDIETLPNISAHFRSWGENLPYKQRIQESCLLSHSWSWGDYGEVYGSVLTPEEAINHDDERLVLELWSLLDNAQVVIGHNIRKFDNKKANTYFIKYGLPPVSPFKSIDTLSIAKRKFKFEFNSLAYLAKYLGVTDKIQNDGMPLWIDCHFGKQEALDTMLRYNFGDVVTQREVYKILQSYDNDGVNMALYYNTDCLKCVSCASNNVGVLTNKLVYTTTSRYLAYRCGSCGIVLRGNKSGDISDKLVRVI